MSAACKFCDDTGSLSKSFCGYLDCTHCGVADARAQLDRDFGRVENDSVVRWMIYCRGVEAGKMLNAAPNV